MEYNEMTGTEIVALCKERGLSDQAETRQELIDRLIAFDNGEIPAVEDASEEISKEESSEEIKEETKVA